MLPSYHIKIEPCDKYIFTVIKCFSMDKIIQVRTHSASVEHFSQLCMNQNYSERLLKNRRKPWKLFTHILLFFRLMSRNVPY